MLEYDDTNKWAKGQIRYLRERSADITRTLELANNTRAAAQMTVRELAGRLGRNSR